MDYEFYLECFRYVPPNFLLDHTALPSLNLHGEDLNPADVEKLCKKQFDVSFGLYSVLDAGEEHLDYARHLIEQKTKWLHQLERLSPKKEYTACSKLLQGRNKSISLKMLKYVLHMKTDPLPGLIGYKNWIFAGSTVALLRVDDENSIILACGGRHLSSLYTLKLNSNGEIADSDVFELWYDEPILEISTNHDLECPLVCIRQQHCISILEPRGSAYVRVFKRITTKRTFFTSAGMRCRILAFSKNNGTILVYDVSKNEKLLEVPHFRNKTDCPVENVWNRIHWLKDGLWITNKKTIFKMDGSAGVNCWDLAEFVEFCGEIHNLFESYSDPNNLYICSTHWLLLVDLSGKKILRKWSHMLCRPPDFGGVVSLIDGEELVILQTCVAEEVVAIVNSPEAALLPPRLVPTPADTFREAKLNLVCLDPVVSERPNFSVIGALLLPFRGGCYQITQNAGGDLFIRKLWKEGLDTCEEDEEKVWKTWHKYEEKCLQISPHVAPVYTEVADASKLFKKELKRRQKAPELPRKRKPRWRFKRHLKLKELPSYQDFLAKRVVDVWEVRQKLQERKRNLNGEIVLSDSEDEDMVRTERVSEWLEEHEGVTGRESPPLW